MRVASLGVGRGHTFSMVIRDREDATTSVVSVGEAPRMARELGTDFSLGSSAELGGVPDAWPGYFARPAGSAYEAWGAGLLDGQRPAARDNGGDNGQSTTIEIDLAVIFSEGAR